MRDLPVCAMREVIERRDHDELHTSLRDLQTLDLRNEFLLVEIKAVVLPLYCTVLER